MLPVGMKFHGGKVAQIIADLAEATKRSQRLKRPFNMRKISDSAVEFTGGLFELRQWR